jgi:hypothetical protein
VSAAAFDFLRRGEDFAPVCISRKKLYCCRRAFAADYHEALRSSAIVAALIQEQRGMFADDAVYAGSASERYAVERLLERMKLGGLSGLLYADAAQRASVYSSRNA